MRVHKNLLGENDRIHSDVIDVGGEMLTDILNGLKVIGSTNTSGLSTHNLRNSSRFYVLLISVGASTSNALGVYIIHTYGTGFEYMTTINSIGYSVNIELAGRTLSINRAGSYKYTLIEIN